MVFFNVYINEILHVVRFYHMYIIQFNKNLLDQYKACIWQVIYKTVLHVDVIVVIRLIVIGYINKSIKGEKLINYYLSHEEKSFPLDACPRLFQ